MFVQYTLAKIGLYLRDCIVLNLAVRSTTPSVNITIILLNFCWLQSLIVREINSLLKGEHPMKCFIKSFILGLNSSGNNQEVCTAVNPIVRSLVTSAMFIIFMAIVSNMLHV